MADTEAPNVHPHHDAEDQPGPGRVVVGVDGSNGSMIALRWALREARLRGWTLHAVLAWTYHPSWDSNGLGSMFPMSYGTASATMSGLSPTLTGELPTPVSVLEPSGIGQAEAEAEVSNALEDAVTRALAAENATTKRPAVTITREMVQAHPSQALLATVTDSDLLVVGSHGHGEFAGALLGSISQHVVSHCRCPVVVVPDTRRRPN
jgi:nucleotide-binding universal stress UspA family protein